MECAAVMAKLHSPLLVVVTDDGSLAGAITASRLLGALIA
jgi:CBS domain-containing protein